MLEYDYPLFRPPAEAESLILQVTLGCSYNNCSFCSMYKSKEYQERSLESIFKEIDELSHMYPHTTKIFLADGDALSISTDRLQRLLEYLYSLFKKLRRVSTYASAQNLLEKSEEELQLLAKSGLKLLYYGIESGSDGILKKITKGVTQKDIITSLHKVPTEMKISATVILGVGGVKYSKEHIQETAKIINNIRINYLSTLQLWLEDEAIEIFLKHFNDFTPLKEVEFLKEQRSFLEQLNPTNKIIFRSNHVSNSLPLSGILPKDNARLVHEIDYVLQSV